jgi:hypothetical protein
MVAIHLDANYIFVEPMGGRSKEEMIRAYAKIINRMRLAGLRLKKHSLDNKASEAFKQCLQEQQMQYKLVPWVITNKTRHSNFQSALHLNISRCR